MGGAKTIKMLYGRDGMGLSVPEAAVAEALADPIDCRPLTELLAAKRPMADSQ